MKTIILEKKNFTDPETNLQQGFWTTNWFGGNKKYEGNFINGKSNGYFHYYNYNGKLSSKGYCINGLREGVWIFFRQSDIELKQVLFKKGNPILTNNQNTPIIKSSI